MLLFYFFLQSTSRDFFYSKHFFAIQQRDLDPENAKGIEEADVIDPEVGNGTTGIAAGKGIMTIQEKGRAVLEKGSIERDVKGMLILESTGMRHII